MAVQNQVKGEGSKGMSVEIYSLVTCKESFQQLLRV